MKRYVVTMSIDFEDGTEMDMSMAVDADNDEGAKDIARDQLQSILIDDIDIIVHDAYIAEFDEV